MHEDKPGNGAIPCDLPTGKPPLETKALDLADILGHEQARAIDKHHNLLESAFTTSDVYEQLVQVGQDLMHLIDRTKNQRFL